MPAKPRALIFDAYGTLFDVHSVLLCSGVDIPGHVDALSQLWRQKQLEFTWLRALMERYADFWQVTGEALRAAVRQLSIEASDAQLEQLMEAYLFPAAFADVKPVLESCQGIPMAILSNGSAGMLQSAVVSNGLEAYFAEIISVDQVRTYKPSPRVYALGPEILHVPAAEILFISSNLWDAAGAKSFGYQVCWCNRALQPTAEGDLAPDITISRLDELAAGGFISR